MGALLTKIRRRSARDWGIFLEAFCLLALAKTGLLLVPFRRLAPRLGSVGGETPVAALTDRQRALARRVRWAVEAAARNVPLGFVCLPQAMAAQAMLRRRGIDATLYLGVRPDEAAGLSAHAWLRTGNFVVTGQRESRRYKALASFGGRNAFPPESRALLAMLKSALGGEFSPVSISDPEALARGIARHRVGAFLYHRLPVAVRAGLPPRVQQALANQAKRNALRSMRQAAELERITGQFRAAGIRFLSVKGPLLALRLYGDSAVRHAGDLDLLIAESDVDRAAAILVADGYRRTRPRIMLTPRQRRRYSEKEFAFESDSRRMRVELRWWLDGVGALPGVVSGARTATLRGNEFVILPGSLEGLYLCLHGAIHGWRRLFWLVDIALLFEHGEIDWAEALREARARGIERALFEAAALTEELMGVCPPAVLAVANERRIVIRLARNAKEQIALPATKMAGARNFLRETAHRLLLHRHLRGKWQIFQPHFHSVRNWEDLPLPDAWFWLYVPLAPILWMRRRSRRRVRPQSGEEEGDQ